MSDFTELFLNRQRIIRKLDCFEIAHPNFSQTYYVVRNARLGITVTHEDSTTHDYQFYPLKVSKASSDNTLDQIYQITLGDLGAILPSEIANIRAADGFNIRPTVNYRVYRSDLLTEPIIGPYLLEIVSLPIDATGATFQAAAPTVNRNATGEQYTFERFPMLRGFL